MRWRLAVVAVTGASLLLATASLAAPFASVGAGVQSGDPGYALQLAAISCDKDFKCEHALIEVAARIYRSRAGNSQATSNILTTATVLGVSGALIATGHVPDNTVRYWEALAGIPFATQDVMQNSAQARLFIVAASGLDQLAHHYETLHDAIEDFRSRQDKWTADRSALVDACQDLQGAEQTAQSLSDVDQAAFTDTFAAADTRCTQLELAATKLDGIDAGLATSADLSEALAADAGLFNDAMVSLSRHLNGTPDMAVRSILSRPFTFVANVIAGTARADDFQASSQDAFDAPYQFPLARVTVADLPDSCPDDLVVLAGPAALTTALAEGSEDTKLSKAQRNKNRARRQAAVDVMQRLKTIVPKINTSADALNAILIAANRIRDANDASVMTVDFKSYDKAVSFTKPS